MPANSAFRRATKRLLARFQGGRLYGSLQAVAMAWDIRTGAWREPELDLIQLALEPGETALDIGANFGLWTHHLVRRLSSGRVIAFEPISSTYRTLRLIAKLLRFRNVEMFDLACGIRSEQAPFVAPLQDSGVITPGLAHLASRGRVQNGTSAAASRDESDETWCEVVALDEFIPQVEDLCFIKCDIEGAELLAFRGAETLIARHSPTVICEVNPAFMEGFGLTIPEVATFFEDKGYRIYQYSRDPSPVLMEVGSIDDMPGGNYVFIHPSRLPRFVELLRSSDD